MATIDEKVAAYRASLEAKDQPTRFQRYEKVFVKTDRGWRSAMITHPNHKVCKWMFSDFEPVGSSYYPGYGKSAVRNIRPRPYGTPNYPGMTKRYMPYPTGRD